MKRLQKGISLLLLLIFLCNTVAITPVFGANLTQAQFTAMLKANGIKLYNEKWQSANRDVYNTYGQIVYGSPHGESKYSKSTWRYENRYLGYDLAGKSVTNTHFPADPGGGGEPKDWSYLTVDGASASWNIDNTTQKSHMLSASLSYDGKSTGYSVNSLGTSKCLLQSLATWDSGFSVKTEHYWNGNKRYATFTGGSMPRPSFSCDTSLGKTSVTIEAGQDSVQVPIRVTASASSGMSDQYEGISATCNNTGASKSDGAGKHTVYVDTTLTLYRKDYPSNTTTEKTYSIPVNGSGTLKSVFGNTMTATAATKYVSLTVKPKLSPSINCTVTASPSSIKESLTGTTVNVTVSVSNIKDGANITGWTFYARKMEETAAQSKTIPGNSPASTTFTFTIPARQVTTQVFKGTVVANGIPQDVRSSSEASVTIIKNQAPTAVINIPQSVYINEDVPYSGTASTDPENDALTYKWVQGGNTISTSATGSIKFTTTGAKSMNLTVTDPFGNADTKSAYVNVIKKPNEKPVAVIDADTPVQVNAPVSISGAGSYDRDGTITEYQWTASGATGSISGVSGTVTYPAAGTYTVKLRVKDDAGAWSSEAFRQVTVVSAPVTNRAPSAVIDAPIEGYAGSSVYVSGLRSKDPEGKPLTYTWGFSGANISSMTTSTGTLTFSAPGTFNMILTVADPEGLSDTVTHTIVVKRISSYPVAIIHAKQNVLVGENVLVDGSASYDPDGGSLQYAWETTGATGGLGGSSKGYISYATEGTKTVTLTVTDPEGLTGTTSATIYVTKPSTPPPDPDPDPVYTNKPPIAVLEMVSMAYAGEDVAVSGAKSSDPDGTIVTYSWGAPGSSKTVTGTNGTVRYALPGTYTVTLTVIDNQGASDSTSKDITIIEPPLQAVVKAGDLLKVNRKVSVWGTDSTGHASFPIANYAWKITPISGGTAADIKYQGTLSGAAVTSKELLFKKAGKYKVELTVTNTRGQTDTSSVTFDIIPDEAPVANFNTTSPIIRDYEKGNIAHIYLNDLSVSNDGDTIVQRIWTYAFDSDNDGNFDDETWDTIDDGNNQTPALDVFSVGKYKIELTVKEAFGQDTIPAFIQDSDYMRGNTGSKANGEKIVEVTNLPPFAGFDLVGVKKADIYIDVANTAQNSLAAINGYINSILKPTLAAANIEANVRVASGSSALQSLDVPFEKDIQRNRTKTVTIPFFSTVVSAIVDTGSIVYKVLANAVTLDVSNGNPVDTVTPEKIATASETKPVNSFNATYAYSDAQGYSGVLAKDGEPIASVVSGSYIDPQTKTASYTAQSSWNSFLDFYNYSDADGYSGSIPKSGSARYEVISGGVTSYPGKSVSDYRTGSSSSFSSSISYSDGDGYSGSLSTSGSSYVISGSEGGSKTVTVTNSFRNERWETWKGTMWGSAYNVEVGRWGGSYSYSDADGYSGTLTKVPGSFQMTGNDEFPYPSNPSVGTTHKVSQVYATEKYSGTVTKSDTRQWRQDYSGTVYKPDSDTRVWGYKQDYSGTVTKPAVDTRVWSYKQNYKGTAYGPPTYSYGYNAKVNYKKSSLGALESITWDQESRRYFIEISDPAMPELQDSNALSSILNNMSNNKVAFIGMGTSANQVQMQNLCSVNDYKGMFALNNNPNLSNAFTDAAQYIVNEIGAADPQLSQYILAGQTVDIRTVFSDVEGDAQRDFEWQFTHDETCFENNTGKITTSGQWVKTPLVKFDKTGMYAIKVRAQDDPTNDDRFSNYRLWSDDSVQTYYLYVHRKPFARFSVSFTGYDGNADFLTSVNEWSYDLDHSSRSDKGIAAKKWQWKESGAAAWTNGALPGVLQRYKTYLVKLEVQDLEGVWSDPYVLTVNTNQVNLPPTVDANPIHRGWLNQPVTTTVTASDPTNDFRKVDYIWSQSPVKPGGTWLTTNLQSFTTSQSATGSWYLHMEAFDTESSFYRVRGPYNIDMIAPQVTASPGSASGTTVNATLQATDQGGSGVKEIRYAWSTSTTKPSSGWSIQAGSQVNTGQMAEGKWYLHAEVYDNAGNSTYRYFGIFQVELLKLENLRITAISDYRWKNLFENPGKKPSPLSQAGIPVQDMPVYRNKNHYGIKVGYAVSFAIDSYGLGGTEDFVQVRASYFALDRENRIFPADIFVETEDGKYVPIAESRYYSACTNLQLRSSSRYTCEGSSDPNRHTWKFDIYLPANIRVVRKGELPRIAPSNMFDYKLLVVLDVQGTQYNGPTYPYTLRETGWAAGKGASYGANRPAGLDLGGWGTNHGEVFWYNLYENALDDLWIDREW